MPGDDDYWDEMENVDYKLMKISDLLKKEKEKIIYEYDFGDGWEHDVILEKILPVDSKGNYPEYFNMEKTNKLLREKDYGFFELD